ncbi:hypothetical protein HC251_07825 [Iamia sp. SCSIO 61187]|nr:hypothetical protein HC251_07825 [Iamia sp. SCSIO 61187]
MAQHVFERQFRSWVEGTRLGRWNAWAPYPTALRAWVFVNVEPALVTSSIAQEFGHQLVLHARFLERNLELDVGGNHLVKNLKALVGLGIRLDDLKMVDRGLELLRQQIDVQVLADGGHFELSPSYHCQVLADLLDIANLLEVAGRPKVDGLLDVITRMRAWLGSMLMPDGDVPLLNDCERVGVARIAALEPTAPPHTPLVVLPDSGYVVAKPGSRIHLIADVGQPCPPDLPAHAQADCLTFELAVDGERIIVDPGTSEYGSGPQRRWERSTAAHNTVAIDGQDQTEVWGSFRAGRRAQATLRRAAVVDGVVQVVASHDGFAHLEGGPVHQRQWLVDAASVVIRDQVSGSGRHRVRLRLLFDSAQMDSRSHARVEDGTLDGSGFSVEMTAQMAGVSARAHPLRASAGASHYASGFGCRHDATAIVVEEDVDLPITWQTTMSLG